MSKVFLKWFILDLQPSLARDPLKSPQILTVIKVLYCLFVVVLFTSMSHVVQVSASNLKRWASSLELCVRGGLKKSAAVGLYRNTHTHTERYRSDPKNWSGQQWCNSFPSKLCTLNLFSTGQRETGVHVLLSLSVILHDVSAAPSFKGTAQSRCGQRCQHDNQKQEQKYRINKLNHQLYMWQHIISVIYTIIRHSSRSLSSFCFSL